MTSSKYLTIPAVAAGALALSAGTVRAAEPTTEELMQQIQQLQSKVQQLETKQQALNSKDVDATVEQVLQDADKRSQLLQMEGFTAGWTKDKGFRIQDAAGNWVLHPNFQFQFRSVTSFRHDGKHGTDDDMENGFEIRRMKFGFNGNAFTPDLTYFFLWNTGKGDNVGGNSAGNVFLEQAWIKYFFNDDWAFRVGQIRNPVFHEMDTSSQYMMAADRSLLLNLLTGSNEAFTQAVTLVYDHKDSQVQAEVGFGDGFNSGNTDFVDKNEGASQNWGIFGRVNFFAMGTREEYKDFTAMGNKSDLLVIGAGGDVTESGDVASYLHTVDVQWENTAGLGLYAAYYGDYIDTSGDDIYNWGALVQASYMVNDRWEVFGRYDYTKLDDAVVSTGGHDEFCEISLGVNWYVGGSHAAKVTVDLNWLPNGCPADIAALDYLATDDDEIVIRGQFQLLL
ncbi:MAG TPA: porin [Tepidisphaeraceae bacterium]